MPRRKHHRAPAPVALADFGAQPWRIDVWDDPDPDRPNASLRRARAYDPLRRMDLEPALFVAAERFRDAYYLAQGAREGVGSVRLEPWQRCHYAVKAADAREEVRQSIQAVGLRLAGVFVGAVINCERIRDMARDMRIGDHRITELIREALERLRDWQTEHG